MSSTKNMVMEGACAPRLKTHLSTEQMAYLILMWGILAMNVMLITFMSVPFVHC